MVSVLYTINSLIITILANLQYYKNCINSNIFKHVPSKWAMNKPHTFIYKKDILINQMIYTHTHKMDDTIFLQALCDIKENSLKDIIETTLRK